MIIDFSPGVQRTLIPVNITEDDILEVMEQFQLTLAVPDNVPPYLLGTTAATVSIVDNEGKSNSVWTLMDDFVHATTRLTRCPPSYP